MSLFKKNPLLKLGLLALVLVGLPAAVFLSQKQANDRSRAAQTVILSFAPPSASTSPISVQPGSTVSIDLMIDPGANAVSFLKTELSYDATKFQVDNGGFQVNQQVFPTTIQGPTYSTGKVSFAVSVGADGTKAIQTPSKVGTLTLRALSTSGISQVGFSTGTQALSISSSSTPTENVVSNTIPAYLQVGTTQTTVGPTPPTVCANNPTEVMLVIDTSGSMSTAVTANKITQAKAAAKNFVDILAADPRNKVGLVSFGTTAVVKSGLTNNFAAVKSQIDTLIASGSTCTECGINKANQEIARSTSTQKKVVILLTDGLANYIEGGTRQFTDTTIPEQKALDAAIAGRTADETVFYTIGLGQTINADFLELIASSTGGKYYPSPTGDQLNSIYNQISQISAKGSVSGFVFNDVNSNKIHDSAEAKLSGWTLQLFPAGSTTPQTFTSDANGFNITGLCNGSYILKEVLQNGWRQTVPVNPNEYVITIDNGNAITGKIFGNKQGNTCADGIDNNGNNFIDIADPICHTDGNKNNPNSYDPNLPEKQGNTCADGLDNNNNNLIDGLDPICHIGGIPTNPYDPNLPETNTCGDGIDNNNNGLIDTRDPICHTDGNPNNPGTFNPNLPETPSRCNDKIDNDNNGLIDEKDATCHTDGNANNPNSYDPKIDGERSNTCYDLKDNNGNNLIDIEDPICHTDGNANNPNSYDRKLPETGGNVTSLNLTLFLHGIGASGDNVNETLSSLSNKNPLHKTLSAKAFIYNVNNQLISSASGQVNYSSASGNYKGRVQTTAPLPAGSYDIRVGTDRHLIRRLPGIQNITNASASALPAVHLVTGDINDDNKLNILDYNILIDCYTDILPAPSCSDPAKKAISDTDDDGKTNQTDYNLFLREIANQPGQ
ncbi:MAG TPA: VWA domain-containing protein [Xanthomonadales bacterium]|nr:VWA domain-containing protein [Xanthomonadales bacterium]